MVGSKVNDILVFLSVVETGSFIAAGKTLGLSRSTAGKAVARLEAGFGARLLHRTTRTLRMTDEGLRLYERGQTIREAIEAVDENVMGSSGRPQGTLRITAPGALGRRLLMPTIRHFTRSWPEVHVEVSFSDRVSNLVDDGFDLALRVGVRTPNDGLVARTLLTDEAYLCAAPSYLASRAQPRSIDELSTHELLQFSSDGMRQRWCLKENTGGWGRPSGRTRLRFDSAEALREAALAAMGICLLPSVVIGGDLQSGELVRVLPSAYSSVPVQILYPSKRLLRPGVRASIDMLCEDALG